MSEDFDFSLELEKPVKVAGTEFKTIKLREPLVKDLRLLTSSDAQKDPIKATNQLYAQLSGGALPPEFFENLPVREMRKITAWFKPFTQEENDTN